MFGRKKKKEVIEKVEIKDIKPKRDIYFELTGKRKEEVKKNDKT